MRNVSDGQFRVGKQPTGFENDTFSHQVERALTRGGAAAAA